MWPQDYRRQPLTPVREESISGGSVSSRMQQPGADVDPSQHRTSIEMEGIQSFINSVANVRSQFGGDTNVNVLASFMANRRPRFTGDGTDDERGNDAGGSGLGETEPDAPPTIPATATDAIDLRIAEIKENMYRNYIFMASLMGNTIEGYAMFLQIILTTFWGMGTWDPGNRSEYPLEPPKDQFWRVLVFKFSIFAGISVGSFLAVYFGRKYSENNVALGFLIVIFVAQLSMTLSGPGYFSVLLGSVTSVWLFRSKFDKDWNCEDDCQLALDRCWRLISGFLLFSTLTAFMARWGSSRVSLRPDDSSRNSQASIPSLSHFWKTYAYNNVYLYPLAFICGFQFLGWAYFYGIVLNIGTILWETGHTFKQPEKNPIAVHISGIIGGIAILAGLGAGLGYILLCLLVDKWGRRRVLTLTNVLLMIENIFLAALWQHIPIHWRMVLVTLQVTLLTAGPFGCVYVLISEVFPQTFRAWCFMFTDLFGSSGAILGITGADLILHTRLRNDTNPNNLTKFAGIQEIWAILVGFSLLELMLLLGISETARKETAVIEGEVYGDWGRWSDRRRRSPEQVVMGGGGET
ncbi:Inorganic phosphate transporter pho84 [Orbilia javanica]|uniref:Inorganic phosphate transporter pho84 n=1 Tax=Orbilia javanica TaxID=47235 RepID=A0AAN8RDI7_9PEZI